jgi:glyoxylase-like metal-dependent hydrolase (beta-lactamase superfamily II)
VRRVVAPNPSPMTGEGTNTYLIGSSDVIVVDPGPADPRHLDRLVELSGGAVRYVLYTHAHVDHAPAARPLAERTGAAVLGPGGALGPDGALCDGDVVAVPGFRLEVLETPGHSSDHLCFLLGSDETPGSDAPATASRVLFTGDVVLGGMSSVVAAPDGDMADYLASLRRLLLLEPEPEWIAPGHGPLLAEREQQVLATLVRVGPASPAELVPAVYPGLAAGLTEGARRQIWAHLRKLRIDERASCASPGDEQARWRAG